MINIINRKIDKIETISVMNDKEVIKLSFECVNQVTDLLKLTDCDHIYINYMNGSTKDRYLVTDLTLNGENVNFTWLLGRNATKNIGKTYFVICAERTDDGTILQEWNSIVASFDVEKGLETLTAETEPYEDIFSQVFDSLDTKLEPTNIKAGDNITLEKDGNDITISSSGGGGTGDYADLENKPKINSVELVGNKSLSDLGIQPSGNYATQSDLATKQDKDFVVTFTDGTPVTSDKTLSEIYSAFTSGKYVYGKMGNTLYTLLFVSADNITFHSVTLYNLTTLIMTSSGITKVDSIYQPQLNAGAGISISGNVISATASFTIAVVQTLPETGNTQTIYLVPNGGTTPNIYDEYVYVNSAWEKIGTTEVDLSNYYTKTETDTLVNAKQDTLTAGQNITIQNGVISSGIEVIKI